MSIPHRSTPVVSDLISDEDVAGSIKLTDEAGADLNWIATVAGQTATLTAVAGQELVNETTYKVEIDVHDGGGNQTQDDDYFCYQTQVIPPL